MIRKSRYLQLIELFPLRPIRSDRELKKATKIVNDLAIVSKPTRDEQDYLDVLSGLIEKFEDEHHQIDLVTGPKLIQFLLQENGLSQAQLSRETGIAKSTLSAVLKGKRSLAVTHIKALCRRFKLDPNAFLLSNSAN